MSASASKQNWNHWNLAVLLVSSGLALLVAVFNYFWTGNGIHGTEGALLVLVSSALIFGASLAFALGWLRQHWLRALLNTLLFLGILGTAVAAYFLNAWLLLGLMVVALTGWALHLFVRPRTAPVAI